MITVTWAAVVAWVILGAFAGIVAGVRIATHIHYKRLKGSLCEKCIRGFWDRYQNTDIL